MILLEKLKSPWSPSFQKERYLLLYTMWLRMRNIVERLKLASPSFQRKIMTGIMKRTTVGGENNLESDNLWILISAFPLKFYLIPNVMLSILLIDLLAQQFL